jgi:hypothetical protein
LDKVVATVESFYVVTITPVQAADDENNFIRPLIGEDRSKVRSVFELDEEHPGLLKCVCTSPMYYQSGVISVEILMVLVHLKLVDVEVLIAAIATRNRPGRPRINSTWHSKDGPTTSRGAVWYLKDIKKSKVAKYYKSTSSVSRAPPDRSPVGPSST